MYDGDMLHSDKLIIDSPDSEETLEDAEESQIKMRNKMVQINYDKVNALYEIFVPQQEFSTEQTYFSIPFTSNNSSESKDIPSESPVCQKNVDYAERRWLSDSQNELKEFYKTNVILMSRSLYKNLKGIKEELIEEVHEMLNIFESMKRKVDRTSKKNAILQNKIDQLLEANIANDVKNIVMQSYVEIKNNEEIERFLKESKDSEKFCNDVVEFKEKLSKQIVQLEKDFAKLEAQSIAFEIALQHKTQENNSLKISNVDCKSSEFEKESREKKNLFESETCVLQTKFVELEKTLKKQTKENYDLLMKVDNLENAFVDEVKRATMGKLIAFDKDNCVFGSKVTHLEKIIAQKIKDFDDVKLELSNRTAKFEAYFEKLKNTKVDFSKPVTAQSLPRNEKDQFLKRIATLKSKLASQDIRSCQKEYHELRTSYNALKVKFDSLNQTKRNTNVSKSSKPKVSVSEKIHTGEFPKPFSKRVSQFTTYSLQKDRKFSKKSQSFKTPTPQKVFKTSASNAKNQVFETPNSRFTPVKQVWRLSKRTQTFETPNSQVGFKTSALKDKNQVFVTPHSRFTPVKQVWRPKQSHSKSFKYSKTEMLSMRNKNESALKNKNNGRFSNGSKMDFQNVAPNNKWKSSSSTRFKSPQETPRFNNQWKIKRNFKSLLIPRELFSNETPVSSPRWNSTSLHRLDTTLNWFLFEKFKC
ncbi:hypothetical protein Tco_0863687 [Tanacetum coccineum]